MANAKCERQITLQDVSTKFPESMPASTANISLRDCLFYDGIDGPSTTRHFGYGNMTYMRAGIDNTL